MSLDPEIFSGIEGVLSDNSPDAASLRFKAFLEKMVSVERSRFLDAVALMADKVSTGTYPVVTQRRIVSDFLQYVNVFSDEKAIEIFQTILSRFQIRQFGFESHVAQLRDFLGQRLIKIGRLREGVSHLRAIPIESQSLSFSVDHKLQIVLHMAEAFFDLNEYADAEAVISSVALLFPKSPEFKPKFIILQAKLADVKEKFLEAGQRYFDLSHRFTNLPNTGKADFLEHALLAAIIGGVGKQRERLMALVYQDERSRSSKAFPVFEKMYRQRLMSRESLKELRPLLLQYYPRNFEGESKKLDEVLERVVVEHNVLAASYVYRNMTLTNLGELLETDAENAETIAARMVAEKRLEAEIDQIDGFIYFEKDISVWPSNTHVQNLWTSLNQIIEDIENDHPLWVAEHTAGTV